MDELIVDTDNVCNLIVKEKMSYKIKTDIKEAHLYVTNLKKVGPPTLVNNKKCAKESI